MISSTSSLRSHWTLDPEVRFLNHGSFGACPKEVLAAQADYRAELEREPVLFLARGLEARVDAVRSELGAFLGAPPTDLVFVPNATTGVNAVVRSFPLESGDRILVTSHGYNACNNAAQYVAERSGSQVDFAVLPFPLQSADQVVDVVLGAVTPRTRLAILDHVTSPTGLVLPIDRLIPALQEQGVAVLIDGAHGPGMLPLDLSSLGADYYTGNCHKWMCAPKGAAFLYVRPERQAEVRPVTISHGANSGRTDRSRFQLEFDWVGTDDPTPVLCIPHAIRFLQGLFPDGVAELQEHNRRLVLAGRETILKALDLEPPVPEDMIGSLASIPLPGQGSEQADLFEADPLQLELFDQHGVEVPIMSFPEPTKRLLRISAQAYNELSEYELLAQALRDALARSG